MSYKEEHELELIEDSVTIEDGQVFCQYPFIRDPNVLSDNRSEMLNKSIRMEQSMKRRGILEDYNAEFKKFIDRGVISEVTKEEIDSYDGPINVISHHGVPQPSKVTTPLRIVSSSSQDNRGHSLNSCLLGDDGGGQSAF